MNVSQTEAIARLRADYGLKAGSTVYTTVKHVSRSGMTRTIAAYVVKGRGVFDVSHLVAAATGMRFDRDRGGVIVGGAGMDMTFHLVYSLSRAMFPKGHRCTATDTGPRRCPSNDHSNDWGVSVRLADDELTAEGLTYDYAADNETRSAYVAKRNERAAEIRERDGLTYRKGRVHRDGGYALTRSHL